MHYFFVFKVLDKYSLFIVARSETGKLITGLIILLITIMNPKASFGFFNYNKKEAWSFLLQASLIIYFN